MESSGGVLVEEQKFMGEQKYRVYMANIDKALKNFEYSSEWADLISALGKLNKAISSNTQYQVIPRRIKISKRLAQCMHPALPSGVHLKALESYDVIFSKTGPERLATELFIYSAGLFPLLGYAAMNVRPTLLGIYEKYFVPLGEKLRPALSGFLSGVLPGYESGLDHYERTNSLLCQVCTAVNPTYFYTCLWECVATNAIIRLPAVSYLLDHYNKKLGMQEQISIMGNNHDVLMSGLCACLNDPVILVQRNTLEFLLLGFPMHTNYLTKDDLIKLVTNALNTILRRDMSLNRRLYSWLLGTEVLANRNAAAQKLQQQHHQQQQHQQQQQQQSTSTSTETNPIDDQSPTTSSSTSSSPSLTTTTTTNNLKPSALLPTITYFDQHSKDVLIKALKLTLKMSIHQMPADLKPYKILISLLDKIEIGPVVLDHVLCDVIRTMSLSNGNIEVYKSANLLFATFDPSYIWNFLILLYEKSSNNNSDDINNNVKSKLVKNLKTISQQQQQQQQKKIEPEVDSGAPSLCEVCYLTEFLLETISLEMYNETTRVYLPRVFLSIIKLLTAYSDKLTFDEVTASLKLCMKIVSRVQPMITSPTKHANQTNWPMDDSVKQLPPESGALEKSKSDSKLNQTSLDDEPIRRSNSNQNMIKKSPKKTKKSKSYSKLLELDKDITPDTGQQLIQSSAISTPELDAAQQQQLLLQQQQSAKKSKSKRFSPSMKLRGLKHKSTTDLKIDEDKLGINDMNLIINDGGVGDDDIFDMNGKSVTDNGNNRTQSANKSEQYTETTEQEYSILEKCIKQYETFFQVYLAQQILCLKHFKSQCSITFDLIQKDQQHQQPSFIDNSDNSNDKKINNNNNNILDEHSHIISDNLITDNCPERLQYINKMFDTLKLNETSRTIQLKNLLHKTMMSSSTKTSTTTDSGGGGGGGNYNSELEFKDCHSSSSDNEKYANKNNTTNTLNSNNLDEHEINNSIQKLIHLKLCDSLRMSIKLASNLLVEMSTFPNYNQNLIIDRNVNDIPTWLKVLVLIACYTKSDKELQIAVISTLFDLISLLKTQIEHRTNPGVTYVVMLPILKFGHVHFLELKTKVLQIITSTLWDYLNDTNNVDVNQISSLLYQLHNCIDSGLIEMIIGHRIANSHIEWTNQDSDQGRGKMDSGPSTDDNKFQRIPKYKNERLMNMRIMCVPMEKRRSQHQQQQQHSQQSILDYNELLTENEAIRFRKFELLWDHGRDGQNVKGFDKTLLKIFDYLSLPHHLSIRTFITKWLQESLLRGDLARLINPLLTIMFGTTTKRVGVVHAHLIKKDNGTNDQLGQISMGGNNTNNNNDNVFLDRSDNIDGGEIILEKDVYAISSEDGNIKYHLEMSRNKKRSPIRSLQKKFFGVTIGNKSKTSNYINDKCISPNSEQQQQLLLLQQHQQQLLQQQQQQQQQQQLHQQQQQQNISLIINPFDNSSDTDTMGMSSNTPVNNKITIVTDGGGGDSESCSLNSITQSKNIDKQSISLREESYYSSCEEETDESFSESESERRDESCEKESITVTTGASMIEESSLATAATTSTISSSAPAAAATLQHSNMLIQSSVSSSSSSSSSSTSSSPPPVLPQTIPQAAAVASSSSSSSLLLTSTEMKRFSGDCDSIIEDLLEHDRTKNRKTYHVTKSANNVRVIEKLEMSMTEITEGLCLEESTPADEYFNRSSSTGHSTMTVISNTNINIIQAKNDNVIGKVENSLNDLIDQSIIDDDNDHNSNGAQQVKSQSSKSRQSGKCDDAQQQQQQFSTNDNKRFSSTSKQSSDSTNSSNFSRDKSVERNTDSYSGYDSECIDDNPILKQNSNTNNNNNNVNNNTNNVNNNCDSVDSGVVLLNSIKTNDCDKGQQQQQNNDDNRNNIKRSSSTTTTTASETAPIQGSSVTATANTQQTPAQQQTNWTNETFEISKKNIEILRQNAATMSAQIGSQNQKFGHKRKISDERKRHFDRLHPLHTHMLLYYGVYDTKQVLYAFQTLRNVIACDCRTFLCLSITTSLSNNPLKQLLVRHRKSILGKGFTGTIVNTEFSHVYRGCMHLEVLITLCLYYARSYFQKDLDEMNQVPTVDDIQGNCKIQLASIELLTLICTELIAIVKDMGKQLACYIADLMTKCKLQKIILHCLISSVHSFNTKIDLTFTEQILSFNDSSINDNKLHSESIQIQLLRLLLSVIKLEHEVIVQKGGDDIGNGNSTNNTNHNSSVISGVGGNSSMTGGAGIGSTSNINSIANRPTASTITTAYGVGGGSVGGGSGSSTITTTTTTIPGNGQVGGAAAAAAATNASSYSGLLIDGSLTNSPTRLGPSTPTNVKYLPNCLISQQPMFLSSVLKALQADHLRHLHRNWTDLITSSLNCFTFGSLTNIVISVIHQICSNIDKIARNIRIAQTPPDYSVSQLEAITCLCHYCLLDTTQQTSLSHLFNQAYPQINATAQSSNTGQLLNSLVHAILSSSSAALGQSQESQTRNAQIMAARNAVLSHLPVIVASVARLWDNMNVGQLRQVKQQILEFLSPISLHHGINFLAAVSVTWQERGEQHRKTVEDEKLHQNNGNNNNSVPTTTTNAAAANNAIPTTTTNLYMKKIIQNDVSSKYLPQACQEQLNLVKLVSSIRVMPMDSFVQTLHQVVKSPPNIHHPPVGLSIEVSALELFYFYMKSAAVPQLGDCWSSLLALLRDGLNLQPPAQFVLLAILNEFVQRCPQMPFQDKKDLRDLHDVTSRLVDALSNVAGACLEQTTWLRRNLAVKEDIPAMISSQFNSNTQFTGNQQYSVQAQSVMASVLANLLDVAYGSQEKDKVVTIVTTLMYNITPYLKNHTTRNVPSFYACSHLLASLSGYQYTRKAWRKDMLDLLLDPTFFQMDVSCLPFWKAILDSLMTYDNTTFRELMGRVSLTQTGSLNIFTSREQEYEQRAVLLKRLAFVIFCSELDQYHKYMPEIQEQLANSLRLPSVVPAVQAAVFLCFRVLLLRMLPDHVTSLWPTIIAEMVQVFLAIEQELKSDTEEFSQQMRLISGMDVSWANSGTQNHLIHWRMVQLETAKLLELGCVLPATNLPHFQMYRWAFVGSQYDGIYDIMNGHSDDMHSTTTSSSSAIFIPHVRRIARLMDLKFTCHSPTQINANKGAYLTLTCQHITTLQDLYGFFSTLGAIWPPHNFDSAEKDVVNCLNEIETILAADFLEKMPSTISSAR